MNKLDNEAPDPAFKYVAEHKYPDDVYKDEPITLLDSNAGAADLIFSLSKKERMNA